MVLQQLGNTTEVDNMRFKDTSKHKYRHEEYTQVRKTGVDAVHESCPKRSNMRKIVTCNMCENDD